MIAFLFVLRALLLWQIHFVDRHYFSSHSPFFFNLVVYFFINFIYFILRHMYRLDFSYLIVSPPVASIYIVVASTYLLSQNLAFLSSSISFPVCIVIAYSFLTFQCSVYLFFYLSHTSHKSEVFTETTILLFRVEVRSLYILPTQTPPPGGIY